LRPPVIGAVSSGWPENEQIGVARTSQAPSRPARSRSISVKRIVIALPAGATETGRLAVLWTSGDPDVAHRVCFMYAHNAHRQKWFDEVRLIVWGPSARLLAGDRDLQAKIGQMLEDGLRIEACRAGADSHGVSDDLRGLGLEVKYMGRPLTNLIREGWPVLTF
jgi:hypothetical protein